MHGRQVCPRCGIAAGICLETATASLGLHLGGYVMKQFNRASQTYLGLQVCFKLLQLLL